MLCLSYKKYMLLVFMICELLILSVHMFSKGFLLTREVINERSKCTDFNYSNEMTSGCWAPKTFNKAIIIIIDALRYDFVAFDNSAVSHTEKFYKHKMNIIEELLTKYPKHGILSKFMADPPTTTMQRLKGLTTGSLPTFIDASHNFASSEITEDNLIDQLKQHDSNIVILGDDTWGELFPNRFHRTHLYPSFNVMDLDTVDEGILDHIFLEMQTTDWKIIIAHFLGVDHCGHRYGPNHFQMQKKLLQMNDMVKNISAMLTDDSLLVVMGDHGMTSSGDHGGDSKEELESALFMFSRRFNILSPQNSKNILSINQIDLVPTLSILLGIPIPFSNLGKVIEILFDHGVADLSSGSVLSLNLFQVQRYLKTYQEKNNEFPSSEWSKLLELYKEISSAQYKNKKMITKYLTLAKLMCVEIWAKFNVWNMILGTISILCCTILIINIIPVRKNSKTLKPYINLNFRHILYLFLIINVSYGISCILSNNGFNLVCCVIFIFYLTVFKISLGVLDDYFFLSFLIFLLFSMCSFSNSFVIVEDFISSFFCLSLLGCIAFKYLLTKCNSLIKAKLFKFTLNFSYFDFLLLGCSLAIVICIRLSHLFWKCREEQYWCDATSLVHISLSSLTKEFHNARYITSILPVVALVVILQRWLQSCGNLNGWEIGIFIARIAPVISGLLLGGYWALQSVPSLSKDVSKIAILFPQVIYLVAIVGATVIFYNPLFIYILPTHAVPLESSTEAPVIPQLFMKLKQTYEERSLKSSKTPVVYGLATAISAPFLIFLELFLLVVVLISGDGMAPGICLLVITSVFCLGVHSLLTWKNAENADSLLLPNWNFIIIWFILSIHGFYSTGHQPTFSTLNWSAAFVGYDGHSSYLFPLILMLLNTFSSHLFFSISLPLLLIVPLSVGFLWPSLRLNKPNCEEMTRGEFLLVERSDKAKEAFFSMSLIYLLLHAIKVLCTSVAALVLRRHLMVWKIFAPHFIFEAVGFIMTCFGTIIGLAFIFRIMSVLEQWGEKLYSKNVLT